MNDPYMFYIGQDTTASSLSHRRKPKKPYLSLRKIVFGVFVVFFAVVIANIIEDQYLNPRILEIEHSVMRSFPLKTYSRVLGWLARVKLPFPLNTIILGSIKWVLSISLEEAERKTISEYSTFNDLFTRKLSPGSRVIKNGITSPVDGTIIYAGYVGDNTQKIKGIQYKEEELLMVQDLNKLKKNVGRMYQIIIYLAPKNYHRFHSFCDFQMNEIKHIPSQLFSVGNIPMRFLRGVLSKNERVVFSGESDWGYVALVSVGSTGVGSISTPYAKLKTNELFSTSNDIKVYETNASLIKGEEIGQFNLGSTVVLFFEAPLGFTLTQREGSIRLGETLGSI